jgi:HEAT repeat protein
MATVDTEIVPALAAALKDSVPSVGRVAAEALGNIGPAAVAAFLESIKKGIETSNPSLRPNSLLAGKIQGILLSRPPAAG